MFEEWLRRGFNRQIDKMRKNRPVWFGHAIGRNELGAVKVLVQTDIKGRREKRKPEKEIIERD